MAAAFLAFLAALLAGAGARDQMLIAALSARRLLPFTLLGVALVTAVLAGVVVAKAAEIMAPMLSPNARVMFAGMAAVIAGLECVAVGPGRQPEEPTRSLFAAMVVLLAHQLTDGARFLVFAIAVATAVPAAAALGGAAGGAATVLIGAMTGEAVLSGYLRLVRRVIGAVFIAVGGWLVLQALH
jgi:Ca2+/H+ antiporter, TMEM165/GDT1 family